MLIAPPFDWHGGCIVPGIMSEEQALAEAPQASVPVVPLMVSIVLAVLVAVGAVGGAGYWLVKTGRLPLGGVKTVEVPVKPEPVKTKLVALDPLLVNLADSDNRSYLRVSLTLKVEDPPLDAKEKLKEEPPAKGAPKNEFEAAERDAALGVLGKETSDALLAADGKERLKQELCAAFKKHVPEVKVLDVMFTEFLVQR